MVFLSFGGAQESIQKNRFRQPIGWRPVWLPYSYSVPIAPKDCSKMSEQFKTTFYPQARMEFRLCLCLLNYLTTLRVTYLMDHNNVHVHTPNIQYCSSVLAPEHYVVLKENISSSPSAKMLAYNYIVGIACLVEL